MKRVLFTVIVLYATLFIQAVAQDAHIFPKGELAPNVHHTENVWLNELSEADSVFNFSATVATFEAGAKVDWHVHPGGRFFLLRKEPGILRRGASRYRSFMKGM